MCRWWPISQPRKNHLASIICERELSGLLLEDDNQTMRLRLRMDFPVTFYTSGDFKLLRQAWSYLKDRDVKLERMRRHDLFSGECDVMSVTIANPIQLPNLYRDLSQRFPSLEYYDADIPISLQLIARTNTHLLGRCRVYLDGEWIQRIEPLSSPWEIDPLLLPLRIMTLSPDVDPSICAPQSLKVQCGRDHFSTPLQRVGQVLTCYGEEPKKRNKSFYLLR